MLPQFELYLPKSVEETSEILLTYNSNARIYAGGTDVLVQMAKGQSKPEALVDIKGLAELRGISYSAAKELSIGALTTHHELENSDLIKKKYAALHDGVSRVGSVQTRNRGTIGGNLCSALPSADSAAPLLALGAKVIINGSGGERELPLEKFYLGIKHTALEPGEILTKIVIPALARHNAQAYIKFSRRNAMDLALMGVAICYELDGLHVSKARIALTTAAPTPVRAYGAEAFLTGKALTEANLKEAGVLAAEEAKPRDSWRSGAEYRRGLIKVLLPRISRLALERMGKARSENERD
ncbi:MAG: xanthine dehydrogenase family protein subunit M [Clostridiales Family XIII bacterium]|jgi:CO/xanthine dehydrogenase FAD-binding subunit|nr:xanthine dehydrogenase family protein subunit M [Clostridiales Family XIII bacterium]